MNRTIQSAVFGAVLALSNVTQAAPITFAFTFDDPASAAQAVGTITLESSLVANPGQNSFSLPNPAVLALNVTVSGAAAGNGQFGIVDFTGVVFETNGGTLNFSQPLIGQATSGSPWGTTPSGGEAGDFNLFAGGFTRTADNRYSTQPNGSVAAPNGVDYFTLGANGGNGEAMLLTAFGPQFRTVPALNLAGVALLLAGVFGGGWWLLRRRQLEAR